MVRYNTYKSKYATSRRKYGRAPLIVAAPPPKSVLVRLQDSIVGKALVAAGTKDFSVGVELKKWNSLELADNMLGNPANIVGYLHLAGSYNKYIIQQAHYAITIKQLRSEFANATAGYYVVLVANNKGAFTVSPTWLATAGNDEATRASQINQMKADPRAKWVFIPPSAADQMPRPRKLSCNVSLRRHFGNRTSAWIAADPHFAGVCSTLATPLGPLNTSAIADEKPFAEVHGCQVRVGILSVDPDEVTMPTFDMDITLTRTVRFFESKDSVITP